MAIAGEAQPVHPHLAAVERSEDLAEQVRTERDCAQHLVRLRIDHRDGVRSLVGRVHAVARRDGRRARKPQRLPDVTGLDVRLRRGTSARHEYDRHPSGGNRDRRAKVPRPQPRRVFCDRHVVKLGLPGRARRQPDEDSFAYFTGRSGSQAVRQAMTNTLRLAAGFGLDGSLARLTRSCVLQEYGDELVPRVGRPVLVADSFERQELNLGDLRGQRLAVFERTERVLRSVDNESRSADVAEASS
jgi:hypothetical protein